jgi:Pyridoxamine 5'-phosphate oxidase
VIGPETAAFLESGCVLIVGTVGSEGEPHATRGWGIDVVSREPVRLRLLLDAYDTVAVTNIASGGRIAITGGCVRTLSSMQLKGRVSQVEAASTADEARAARYLDAMVTVIHDVDGTPRERVARLTPSGYVACSVEVDEFYDQSPGPGAGTAIEVASS